MTHKSIYRNRIVAIGGNHRLKVHMLSTPAGKIIYHAEIEVDVNHYVSNASPDWIMHKHPLLYTKHELIETAVDICLTRYIEVYPTMVEDLFANNVLDVAISAEW